jgi:mannose-6-phosphate isomerase-like protein (cupin superfamily)
MKVESHANNTIKKPWGYEYLVYQNQDVALWFLFIASGHQTSFHSHPNKTTGLIILEGLAEVNFFNNSTALSRCEKIMIRKGLFHSTKSLSPDGTYLFEIETPNNKLDLVRFKDAYGREGKPYEDASYEYPKASDSLSIENLENFKNPINFCNCILSIIKVSSIEYFKTFGDKTNIMFLTGGLLTEYDISVISPGDIVAVEVIKKLSSVFSKIKNDTYVLILNKNEKL